MGFAAGGEAARRKPQFLPLPAPRSGSGAMPGRGVPDARRKIKLPMALSAICDTRYAIRDKR